MEYQCCNNSENKNQVNQYGWKISAAFLIIPDNIYKSQENRTHPCKKYTDNIQPGITWPCLVIKRRIKVGYNGSNNYKIYNGS